MRIPEGFPEVVQDGARGHEGPALLPGVVHEGAQALRGAVAQLPCRAQVHEHDEPVAIAAQALLELSLIHI